jgi:A/G-specific adenine glycosylase
MTPTGQAGDFAQAMMDLGATICRPKTPNCPACPLSADCAARASGTPEAFPAPKVKTIRPRRHGIAEWIERDGAVWLVRRPARGLLGGMPALPGGAWTDEPTPSQFPPLARIRHVFTHFALDLDIVRADHPRGDGWWQRLDRLAEAGLPTLYRRAGERVLAHLAPLEEAPNRL